MSHPRPLIFLLVHGIGPQNAPFQDDFLSAVRRATQRHLEDRQQPALVNRLVMLRADWSHLYTGERRDWLHTLFPETGRRGALWRRELRMFAWALILLLLPAAGAGLGAFLARGAGAALLWGVLGFLGGLLAAWGTARAVVLPRFPWGDIWTMGRPFEANSLSDLILYESDAPREKIIETVMDVLGPVLSSAYPIGSDDVRPCLPIVLGGHSLGTVVVYDALLGITARANGKVTAAQREMRAMGHALSEGRRRYLTRLETIQETLCPLGMVTMGSPIALFLFRKPEILTQRDLWKYACPPLFRPRGSLATQTTALLRWRWQNFWHAADFVAHRLEALFNEGFPGGHFVEDRRISPPAGSPIAAHSTYWTDRGVIDGIGMQLAEILLVLP